VFFPWLFEINEASITTAAAHGACRSFSELMSENKPQAKGTKRICVYFLCCRKSKSTVMPFWSTHGLDLGSRINSFSCMLKVEKPKSASFEIKFPCSFLKMRTLSGLISPWITSVIALANLQPTEGYRDPRFECMTMTALAMSMHRFILSSIHNPFPSSESINLRRSPYCDLSKTRTGRISSSERISQQMP
jgi:hypothetical protein